MRRSPLQRSAALGTKASVRHQPRGQRGQPRGGPARCKVPPGAVAPAWRGVCFCGGAAVILGLRRRGPGAPGGRGCCWERRVPGIWKPDWSGPWSEGAVRNETVGAANSSVFFFFFFVILLFNLHTQRKAYSGLPALILSNLPWVQEAKLWWNAAQPLARMREAGPPPAWPTQGNVWAGGCPRTCP